MIDIIFTSDYEIHGNGEGSPLKLMIEPTKRLMNLLGEYDAKLTIMADVAEIMKFGEYKEIYNKDIFYFDEIISQLKLAKASGHDVQLHIHPAYFNAKFSNQRWELDWSEYNIARLPYERLLEIIKACKNFLENHLKQIDPGYECNVFRAANWSMKPTANIIRALIENNFKIDTSVFKFGKRSGLVNFDYTSAYSDTIPYSINENDICSFDPSGKIFEFPIYSEEKRSWQFFTINRLFRLLQTVRHPIEVKKYAMTEVDELKRELVSQNKFNRMYTLLTRKYARKMDFNQCSGKQLIDSLIGVEKKYGNYFGKIPVVLIGHSKLFTKNNVPALKTFLEFINKNRSRFGFVTFDQHWKDNNRIENLFSS